MIPRILFRTVPAETTAEVEAWWEHACSLHPGWEHRTYRDPIDPTDWATSDLWPKCLAGAQFADVIRLEALERHGGVYVDSDVEVFRPFTPLLGVEMFAGWEDDQSIPNAVLGAVPHHPAVRLALHRIREYIEHPHESRSTAERIWIAGNMTTVLQGRPDVLTLPPGSLYPVHYRETSDVRDPMRAWPWAFCRHHWRHSWK